MTTTDAAVWVDADYDTERASDGCSRYGAYVRNRIDSFADCWDGTDKAGLKIHFAETAWRVATGPIMAPGYVRYHRRIRRTELTYSYWDGSLTASVDLIASWPRELAESCGWMERTARGWWRDWPIEYGGAYCEPSDEDLAKAPYLLTSASLRFTVPDGQLPHPPHGWRGRGLPDLAELVSAAQQSVSVVVQELNRVIAPVMAVLER